MKVHMIDGKEFIETADAVIIAEKSKSHLRLLARNSLIKGHPGYGKLPCRKVFGRWAYDKEKLEALARGEKIDLVIESEEASKEDVNNGTRSIEGREANLDL